MTGIDTDNDAGSLLDFLRHFGGVVSSMKFATIAIFNSGGGILSSSRQNYGLGFQCGEGLLACASALGSRILALGEAHVIGEHSICHSHVGGHRR